MKKRDPEENVPGEPPMTPMIDVIFQLLIFFMVTLRFTAAEGKLLSQLPKKGDDPFNAPEEIHEVKILLCAEGEAGLRMHAQNKGTHDAETNRNLRRDSAVLMVDSRIIGTVLLGSSAESKAANVRTYDRAAREAFQVYASFPDPKPPVKIDADSPVAYEHVIGVIGALKKYGVENIEYEINPRLAGLWTAGPGRNLQR